MHGAYQLEIMSKCLKIQFKEQAFFGSLSITLLEYTLG